VSKSIEGDEHLEAESRLDVQVGKSPESPADNIVKENDTVANNQGDWATTISNDHPIDQD
jgi:hypothetical protein